MLSKRVFQIRHLASSVRQQSTVPAEYAKYQDLLRDLSGKKDGSDEARKLIEEIEAQADAEVKSVFYNQAVHHFAKTDYSVVNEFSWKLEELGKTLDTKAAIEAIKHNPGRVNTSWELYQKWPREDPVLLAEVLKKVTFGDLVDQEEGYVLDERKLGFAFQIVNKMSSSVPPEVRDALVEACVENDLVPMLALLELEGAYLEKLLLSLEEDDKIAQVFSLIGEPSSKDVWKASLPAIANSKPNEKAARFAEKHSLPEVTKVAPTELLKQTVEQLQSLKLDAGDGQEALALRLAVLKTVGIHLNDMQRALELFHEYQTREPYKRDQLQKSISVVLAYHAVTTKNRILIQVSESMAPQTPLSAESVAAVILAHGALGDPDAALDVYNSHIQKVAKDNSNHLEMSDSSLLTESLIAVYLAQRDRDFAELIRNGATGSGLISRNAGTTRIKSLFKDYGELAEQNGDLTEPLLTERLKTLI